MTAERQLFDTLEIDPDRRWFITRRELAGLCNVDVKTLHRWQNHRGFPRAQKKMDNRLDVRCALRWLASQVKETPAASHQSNGEFRSRWEEEKTLKAQLEREITAGKYVDAEERLELEMRAITELRNTLMNLGRTLAPRLTSVSEAADIEEVISVEVREILTRLATQWLEREEQGATADARTADRERVPQYPTSGGPL